VPCLPRVSGNSQLVQKQESLVAVIWGTPLLRHVLIVVLLGALLVPAYDLFIGYPSFEELLISWVI